MMIFCLVSLGTCEYFDVSLSDYAVEHTSVVLGVGYELRNGVVARPDGTLAIPPADEETMMSELAVRLWNPQNYGLGMELDTGENALNTECTQGALDEVMIRLTGGVRKQAYTLTLELPAEDGAFQEGLRHFYPYSLPIIWCYSFRTALKELRVNRGTLEPSFNPEIKEYTLEVEHEVKEISIQGIAESEGAVVTGDGTKPLEFGDNRFLLTVTAENGVSIREYILKVNRKPPAVITITFDGLPEDETLDLTGIPDQALRWTEDTSIIITITSTFDEYQWYLDGKLLEGERNPSLSKTARGFNLGRHRISCRLIKEGALYSKTLVFTVE